MATANETVLKVLNDLNSKIGTGGVLNQDLVLMEIRFTESIRTDLLNRVGLSSRNPLEKE